MINLSMFYLNENILSIYQLRFDEKVSILYLFYFHRLHSFYVVI